MRDEMLLPALPSALPSDCSHCHKLLQTNQDLFCRLGLVFCSSSCRSRAITARHRDKPPDRRAGGLKKRKSCRDFDAPQGALAGPCTAPLSFALFCKLRCQLRRAVRLLCAGSSLSSLESVPVRALGVILLASVLNVAAVYHRWRCNAKAGRAG